MNDMTTDKAIGGADASVYGGVAPCPNCGQMTYRGKEHKCPRLDEFFKSHPFVFEPAAEATPEVTPQVKDKSREMIWGDCAECARKHLDAAYAALTTLGVGATLVASDEIYFARALIALRESKAGYPGNFELALGCLGMAELMSVSPVEPSCAKMADVYRQYRLVLIGYSPDMMGLALPSPRPEAWAAAHITEALRELPALADRIHVMGFICGAAVMLENVSEILEILRTNIKWVRDVYELRGVK